jgi:hypothetical protein
MFFGQFSWAVHLMTSLITALKKNKHSFKTQERTDPHFCSKFMYAIDIRFQLWLKECMLQTQQNRVDDSILNFTSLIKQVCFGTLELKLHPPSPNLPNRQPRMPSPPQNRKAKASRRKTGMTERKRKKERSTCVLSTSIQLTHSSQKTAKHGEVLSQTRMSADVYLGLASSPPLVHPLALLYKLRQCREPCQSQQGAVQQDLGFRQLHAGNPRRGKLTPQVGA